MLRIINFGGLSILAFLFISENLKESYLTGIWLKCRKRVKEKSTGQLVPQGLEKKNKNKNKPKNDKQMGGFVFY